MSFKARLILVGGGGVNACTGKKVCGVFYLIYQGHHLLFVVQVVICTNPGQSLSYHIL